MIDLIDRHESEFVFGQRWGSGLKSIILGQWFLPARKSLDSDRSLVALTSSGNVKVHRLFAGVCWASSKSVFCEGMSRHVIFFGFEPTTSFVLFRSDKHVRLGLSMTCWLSACIRSTWSDRGSSFRLNREFDCSSSKILSPISQPLSRWNSWERLF